MNIAVAKNVASPVLQLISTFHKHSFSVSFPLAGNFFYDEPVLEFSQLIVSVGYGCIL
jgi:hypothetical protein